MQTPGQLARLYRRELNYKQADIANMTGLTAVYISQIESDKRRLTPQAHYLLSKIYGDEFADKTRVLIAQESYQRVMEAYGGK